ncbi:MAG TPA: hypothetical protein PLY62_03355 [Bacteroidales bacterium]|jgi:hypothetical protein|nr:hypothetical protein [Thermoclostridium sp.]HPH53082.1 hypothetical protein [Bacteroidales bacterium]
MPKNAGEYDELRIKLRLIELRDSNNTVTIYGKRFNINSVGLESEFASLPNGTSLRALSDAQIESLANMVGAGKARGSHKADVNINGDGFSVKSHRSAPPAIVNHTPRWGWVRICNHLHVSIDRLDKMVQEYFQLRLSGQIGEDIYNNDPRSPFKNEKEYLRPIINYFLFSGTGEKDSDYPAKYVLDCADPYDISTWEIYDETNYLDLFWDDMKFSMREKGFEAYPYSRPCDAWKTPLARPWATKIDGQYKGSLHIRVR